MRRDHRDPTVIRVTDDEQSSLAHHLRIAAEQYDRDAKTMQDAGQPRLEAQFQEQAQRARHAAEFFDGADIQD